MVIVTLSSGFSLVSATCANPCTAVTTFCTVTLTFSILACDHVYVFKHVHAYITITNMSCEQSSLADVMDTQYDAMLTTSDAVLFSLYNLKCFGCILSFHSLMFYKLALFKCLHCTEIHQTYVLFCKHSATYIQLQ
jgi:nitrate/nitrite transporter NarK